jgi:proteasome accessory factor B
MHPDERLLNLIFVLFNTRRPLTREELRTKVGGYDSDASDEAFQRMFERDKEKVKSRGVPIETVQVDPGFNDALGYRIDPKKFFLTELELDAQDRAILAEAAKTWTDAQLAKAAESAADKIGDTDDGLGLSLGLTLNHESASTLFVAIDDERIVRFDYLTKGDTAPKTRTVEPWQVLLSGGHWYLVGYDHARQEQRTFKLARFKSGVTVLAEPITHFKPADFDIMAVVSYWRQAQDGDGLASVAVQHGHAGTLRIQADSIEAGAKHDVLTIRYANEEILARDIAVVIDDVVSVEPPALRAAVTRIIGEVKKRHES